MATLDLRNGHTPRSYALSWYVQAMLVLALAWGAFAFGAVYPWAYWPLAATVQVVGFAALLMPSAESMPHVELRWLGAAFGLFAVAATLQLLPLPLPLLERVSPHTLEVIANRDLTVAAGAVKRHALSIAPEQTPTGIVLFASFALLVLGSARVISIRGARGLAEALTVLGVLLALVGIIQNSLATNKIYGFWTPQGIGGIFGPYVNKNHFAGWMLMALPVTLGLLSAGVAYGLRGVAPTWRERVLWLSSADASRIALLAAAAAVMALSLMLTMSRSGISAMTLALAVTGIVAVRRQRTAIRRTIAIGYIVMLTITVFAWTGVATVVTRFSSANWGEFNGRLDAWDDALGIASRFPLAGTGLNTYGVATLFYQQHDLAWHYAAAHNDYLQLLAEGGLLLTVPALACVAAFAALVRRRFREETSATSYWLRAGAVTGIAAVALQETVEFSLQMPGNAAVFAVVCGIALHKTPARRSTEAVDGHPTSVRSPTIRDRA